MFFRASMAGTWYEYLSQKCPRFFPSLPSVLAAKHLQFPALTLPVFFLFLMLEEWESGWKTAEENRWEQREQQCSPAHPATSARNSIPSISAQTLLGWCLQEYFSLNKRPCPQQVLRASHQQSQPITRIEITGPSLGAEGQLHFWDLQAESAIPAEIATLLLP